MPAVPGMASRMIAAIVCGPSSAIMSARCSQGALALLGLGGRVEGAAVEERAEEVHRAGRAVVVGPAARVAGDVDREVGAAVVRAVGREHLDAGPVCSRAIRIACSLASAPPLVKNTLSRSPGVWLAISRAASERAALACCGATVHRYAACSWIADTIRGCWWPRLVKTSWEVKSS